MKTRNRLAALMILGLVVALAGAAQAVPWDLPPETVIAVDFGPGPNLTETGWSAFTVGTGPDTGWLGGPYSNTYGAYTVRLSADGTSGFPLRFVKSAGPTDAGDFTWGDVYGDLVFTYDTIHVKIDGLVPNHTYQELDVISYVYGVNGQGRKTRTSLTLGTTSTVTPIDHIITGAPTVNNDLAALVVMYDVTATALGEIEFSYTSGPNSPDVAQFLPGFWLLDFPAPPPSGSVPEPAGLGLMGLALLGLRRRRS